MLLICCCSVDTVIRQKQTVLASYHTGTGYCDWGSGRPSLLHREVSQRINITLTASSGSSSFVMAIECDTPQNTSQLLSWTRIVAEVTCTALDMLLNYDLCREGLSYGIFIIEDSRWDKTVSINYISFFLVHTLHHRISLDLWTSFLISTPSGHKSAKNVRANLLHGAHPYFVGSIISRVGWIEKTTVCFYFIISLVDWWRAYRAHKKAGSSSESLCRHYRTELRGKAHWGSNLCGCKAAGYS